MSLSSSRAAILATAAAVLAVGGGLYVIGTPARARAHRLDEMRVSDLSSISRQVELYRKQHAVLPSGLDTLRSDGLLSRIPRDPVTDSPYAYFPSGERSYRLCATFAEPSDTNRSRYDEENIGPHSWKHGAGESCFDLTASANDTK